MAIDINRNQQLNLGYTFDYFIPAVLLIIIGGVCFLVHFALAAALLIIGLFLLLLQKGIEIDENSKRVRRYYSLFSLRFGKWTGMKNIITVVLSMTNESQTLQHRSGETTMETKTFDIYLISDTGFSTELNDFKNYNDAVKTMKMIADTFAIGAEDKVAETRHAALLRRKEKDYRK